MTAKYDVTVRLKDGTDLLFADVLGSDEKTAAFIVIRGLPDDLERSIDYVDSVER